MLIPGYDPFASTGGCDFDDRAATEAIAFFHECLTHIEGAVSKKPFLLEPWQRGVIGNLFGWKRPNGSRRYREAFIKIPRKNGKTPMCAGIANFILFCDHEPGAQNYCAAADREQAALLYRHAKGMIENEPELSSRAVIYHGVGQRQIAIPEWDSFLKVLSADADTKHGGNSHLVLVDELHAQPNRDLMDVLTTSMASANRRQPLMISITTSDFDRDSICNEKDDYAHKVRDGVIDDWAFLPVIYEASSTDDWTDPAVWRKANPNFGVSVSEEYFERECMKAQETPAYENTFKRLHLNIRTEQAKRVIPMDQWDRCGDDMDESKLIGRRCFGGLDLSNKFDLSAFSLVFPPASGDPCWRIKVWLFIPADNARQRERRDRVPYETWSRQNYVVATPGNVIDYEWIKDVIRAARRMYDIQEIGFDPWGATQIAIQLRDDGLRLEEVRQGFQTMSEPTKEMLKLIAESKFRHERNPCLRWNASNFTVREDPAGNIKPDKDKSTERIDGLVATVNAMARALRGGGQKTSIYETRGLVSV